jgi:hypothetical protein
MTDISEGGHGYCKVGKQCHPADPHCIYPRCQRPAPNTDISKLVAELRELHDEVKIRNYAWAVAPSAARLVEVLPTLLTEIERLTYQNELLLDRLEANFAWQFIDGVKTKVKVEPGSIPDGIDCRDETIKLQDAHIERLTGLVRDMEGALEWYGEQARLARLIHAEGDAGRHALADDGGKRARAALTAAREHGRGDDSSTAA